MAKKLTPNYLSLCGKSKAAPSGMCLQESTADTLEYILRQIPTDFWAATHHNQVFFQSDRSVEAWGNFQGLDIGELDIPGELVARLQRYIDLALSGEIVEYETTFPTTTTQAKVYYNKLCPLRDEKQKPIGVMGFCREITEQKEKERLQVARRRLAERLNKVSTVEEALKLCFETTLRISRIKWASVMTVGEDRICKILFYNGVPREIRSRIHGVSLDEIANLKVKRDDAPSIAAPSDYQSDFAAIIVQHKVNKLARFSMCHDKQVVAALSIAVRESETLPQWCIDELKTIATQTEATIVRIRDQEKIKEDRQFLRQLVHLQEQERHLLSSEIHDGLIQDIVGAQMVFETLIGIGTDTESECPKLFRQASQMLGNALEVARSFISEIRPLIIEEEGIAESINFLINRFDLPFQKRIVYTHDEDMDRFNPIIEGLAFRLVQDGLQNAVLHSQATTIKIHLAEIQGFLVIDIEDNGVGFDPREATYKGFGVSRLREKPSLFGGHSKIYSEPGHGTKIHIELPVIRMEEQDPCSSPSADEF